MVEGGQKINVRLNVGPYLPQMMRDAGFVDVQLEWYIWPTVSTQRQTSPTHLNKHLHDFLICAPSPSSLYAFRGALLTNKIEPLAERPADEGSQHLVPPGSPRRARACQHGVFGQNSRMAERGNRGLHRSDQAGYAKP